MMRSALRGLTRWFRDWWPRARWSWPSLPPVQAEGPADLAAVRLPNPTGEDVVLVNHGLGEALDVVVESDHVRPADGGPPGALHHEPRTAAVPFLGAGVSYVVHLTPGGPAWPAPALGYWVRVAWRNRDGSLGEACAYSPDPGEQSTLAPALCPDA